MESPLSHSKRKMKHHLSTKGDFAQRQDRFWSEQTWWKFWVQHHTRTLRALTNQQTKKIVYHSGWNGKIKRTNWDIKGLIKAFVKEIQHSTCKDSEWWIVMSITLIKGQHKWGDIGLVRSRDQLSKRTAWRGQLITMGLISWLTDRSLRPNIIDPIWLIKGCFI